MEAEIDSNEFYIVVKYENGDWFLFGYGWLIPCALYKTREEAEKILEELTNAYLLDKEGRLKK